MTSTRTKIGSFEVELDTDMNGDGQTTGCWVSFKEGIQTFSASLACLQDTGELTSTTTDMVLPVPSTMIEQIAKWAQENGY